MTTAERYHDFSAGHRVVGHENKCRNLHGHNYRVTFTISGEKDGIGRVIDFGVIGKKLCEWLEDNWDHKMLIYSADPLAKRLKNLDKTVTIVGFNPTAENMAEHLVNVVGPKQLKATNTILIKCKVQETRKCSASYYL